jgi:hypothetical protein
VHLDDPAVTSGTPVGTTSTVARALNDSEYVMGDYTVNGLIRAFLLLPTP